MTFIFFLIKRLLDSVFAIIKVSVRVILYLDLDYSDYLGKGYQPQPSSSADNSYPDLDYSGYHQNLIHAIIVYYRLPSVNRWAKYHSG